MAACLPGRIVHPTSTAADAGCQGNRTDNRPDNHTQWVDSCSQGVDSRPAGGDSYLSELALPLGDALRPLFDLSQARVRLVECGGKPRVEGLDPPLETLLRLQQLLLTLQRALGVVRNAVRGRRQRQHLSNTM
eukprot:2167111-Pyramimonas_sp.AAC.1